jgi:hypothetical protein
MSTDAVGPIRRLEIRMSVPRIGDDEEPYPVAKLLIDGVDVLAPVGHWGYAGWPAEFILTDNFPLLPAASPRRVIVYVEPPDPGGLAPQISGDGDMVVWSDLREVYQVGDNPLDFSGAYSWSPVGVPDLVFDARQYTTEVRRATAAREWESVSWQAALILRACLVGGDPMAPGDDLTPGDEWQVGFVEPDRDHAQHYRVTYWTEDLRAVASVSLTAAPGPPEQQARSMYEYLLATPTDDWPSTQHTSTEDR